MEVMGLLVIVILLLVIGVVVLRFSVRPSSSTSADVRSSVESTRLLQALVLTTVQGKSFQEHAVACSQDSAACQRFRQELEYLFSVLLKKGKKYSFYLLYQDQKLVTLDNCPVGVLSSYPFSANGGFYKAQLRLCTAFS